MLSISMLECVRSAIPWNGKKMEKKMKKKGREKKFQSETKKKHRMFPALMVVSSNYDKCTEKNYCSHTAHNCVNSRHFAGFLKLTCIANAMRIDRHFVRIYSHPGECIEQRQFQRARDILFAQDCIQCVPFGFLVAAVAIRIVECI